MTQDRDFKALVRARMRASGENYTTARAALRRPRREGASTAAPGDDAAGAAADSFGAAYGLAEVTDRPADPGYAAALAEQRRLVARHVDGERLRRIPARRKARAAVLLHLLSRFEPGRDYAEAEVNALLARAHEDYAWLRRELVEYRYLQRAAGRYRVVSQVPTRHGAQAQEVPAWEAYWLPGFLGLTPRPPGGDSPGDAPGSAAAGTGQGGADEPHARR